MIVDDDVNGSTGGVATGLGQGQGFLVHALPTKSGIAVHQHGQYLVSFGVSAAVHAGSNRPLHDGVHNFQVRWVEGQGQVNGTTRGGDIRAKTLVVFDVARRQLFWGCVVKLGKQIFGQLAHGVDQHIQTAPVGHANHNLLDAKGTSTLDQLIHGRNKALTALQRETFLPHIFGV